MWYVLLVLQFALAVRGIELNPDKPFNISASDRTIGGGTWSAFFRIVIATSEHGRTENNDAEIQLIYHKYDGSFIYNVISKSPHMSDIYTCSVPHDPAKGYGHTALFMNTNYYDGTTCMLRYNIYDINGNVQLRNPIFKYGKKQPRHGCSAPRPKSAAVAEVKKKEVSVERNTKNTNVCIPEAGYTVGEAKTSANELCDPTEVHTIFKISAHNCKGKLYMCDGVCAKTSHFPGKEKGWCVN